MHGRVFDQVARLTADLLDSGFEGIGQFRDLPGEYPVILDGFHAGLDGATALMAQYQDERGAEHGNAVFKACQAFVRDEVAGQAYGEKIAPGGIESVFRCNARVRAAQHRHKRVLAGNQCFSFILEVVGFRVSADIALVALHQPFQCLIRADDVFRLWWRGVFLRCLNNSARQGAGQ
ncbi:hypothetical protein D3C84_692660 [compost metagenome]